MAPFSTQPPQEPALEQLGVEPVGFRPAMFPRDRDTGEMQARVMIEQPPQGRPVAAVQPDQHGRFCQWILRK